MKYQQLSIVTRPAVWVFLFTAALIISMQAGCSSFSKGGSTLLESWMPPTPSQEARNVFNVYDADVRRKSLSNLSAASFGGEEPYVRLYRLLIDDPDPTVRAASLNAIGLHGHVEDVPLIVIRLDDVSEIVRWEASLALQKIHNNQAIKPLLNAALTDDDPDVRAAAAKALGQYANINVFNVLVSLLDDTHFGVVQAAKKSLVTLTGQKLGLDGGAWLTWMEKRPGHIFANQQTYYWQPYKKPRTLVTKVKFWKKEKTVTPKRPTGVNDDAS